MKRFLSAVALCLFLLIAGLFIFLPYTRAANNPIIALLTIPAPPPPNPLIKMPAGINNYNGVSKNTEAPKDDAPIEELLAYWVTQNTGQGELYYSPKPSERVTERILAEIEKKPETGGSYLNILPDTPEVVERIKRLYDTGIPSPEGGEDYVPSDAYKSWLTNHSKYFSDELLQSAQQVRDDRQYVTNHEELLTLAHVDWEKARPIVERLYTDSSQPVSQILARWALYKHAVENNDSGDADRYRDELKRTVEDKSAGGGMRDLAMDALVREGDFTGRDDWYYSLLDDETLYDIRVNDQTYTGLTTLILNSKPGKYNEKMLELVKSNNLTVRNAAIRNLTKMIDAENPEVIAALLPWLENPKWAKDVDGSRRRIIELLANIQMPESVPGLLAVLNEKPEKIIIAPPANRMANTSVDAAVDYAPYRSSVITALAKQKDPRAISPLRQLLPELQDYERTSAVSALLACGGFSTGEQIDALELVAKTVGERAVDSPTVDTIQSNSAMNPAPDEDEEDSDNSANAKGNLIITQPSVTMANVGMATNVATNYVAPVSRPFTGDEVKLVLGRAVMSNNEPDEPLVTATIDRIGVLERKDPATAENLRFFLQNWKGAAINAYLLRELKENKANSDAIIKLLSLRKELREKQSNEVFDIRGGSPTALGISACLLENDTEYDAILSSDNIEAKTAMFACARLIRAKLPVQKVAENLKNPDKLLSIAAERYLESEDSPEARSFVFALHPNEGKVSGATLYFSGDASNSYGGDSEFLSDLFASLGTPDTPAPFYYGYNDTEKIYRTEKRLQKEIKEDKNLLGVYSYDTNFVRIYNDKAVYSWEEDDSRYRERTLEPAEFENLQNFLAAQQVNNLPPFISPCEECESNELLMLGKQGGRRVYVKTGETPEFFTNLVKIFDEMRVPQAKLRYRLEKNLPGLEILFADDNLKAQTVWKNAGDLRVLIENEKQREQIDAEMKRQQSVEEKAENYDYDAAEVLRRKRIEERKYENYSWQKIAQNQLAGAVSQPPAIEYIPKRDGLAVVSQTERWKRRTANFELRSDEEGIYKITRGQIAKIRAGYYDKVLATPDGRWAFATKYGDGATLVRVNLLTNRETPVNMPDTAQLTEAVAYLAPLNKVLVFVGYVPEYDGEDSGETNGEREGQYYLLDPETGAIQPAKGEIRPLAQQTFRALQPTANADEFWAAIPDTTKNQTSVGTYNAKTLTFKSLLKIPKISFDSMNMWVDETEKKIYFVYDGHLLALPLTK